MADSRPPGEKLICVGGPLTRQEFPLTGTEVSIGRAPGNTICLPDSLVSRQHAVLRRTPAGWVVRNLSARHGTLVNGFAVETERVLKDGDILTLGSSALSFAGLAPAAAPPTSDVEDHTIVGDERAVDGEPRLDRTLTGGSQESGSEDGTILGSDLPLSSEDGTVLGGDLPFFSEDRTILGGDLPLSLGDRTVPGEPSPLAVPQAGSGPARLPAEPRTAPEVPPPSKPVPPPARAPAEPLTLRPGDFSIADVLDAQPLRASAPPTPDADREPPRQFVRPGDKLRPAPPSPRAPPEFVPQRPGRASGLDARAPGARAPVEREEPSDPDPTRQFVRPGDKPTRRIQLKGRLAALRAYTWGPDGKPVRTGRPQVLVLAALLIVIGCLLAAHWCSPPPEEDDADPQQSEDQQ